MYANLAIAALASMAAAMPAPQAGSSPQEPLKFAGMSLRSASPIHFGQINANGSEFLIGAEPATYKPDVVEGEFNNQTVFTYVNGQGTIGLLTSVPGGQQIYVTEGNETIGQVAGQLKFTQAHTARTDGPAIYTGFENVYDATLKFENSSWVACPSARIEGAYTVYAASRFNNATDECLGFNWRVVQLPDNTTSAWQYTK
ncbi:hypothetical protein CKM354_000423700 [Cercospora kikuchii]|uniref:Uncharacterized protein n=1 Tax=Cercospora kikuchii TaxID=84275 RepID=A0A9P3CCW5_9PEZI|nr:uncharacterized protein CKM354_000423700 [Cercospora kikuchii]GIZ40917.1 hypothetical protein CKM354_000423700 [Cercospora kikuchii]